MTLVVLLLVTLAGLAYATDCSESSFRDNVDLNSGKIRYPISYGVYYTDSPCYSTPLNGNIVITNELAPSESDILHYPNSDKIGIINLDANNSFFYKYDGNYLSKIYYMSSGGKYIFNTSLSYQSNNLTRALSYFANGSLKGDISFLINGSQTKISSNTFEETYFAENGKIVRIDQNSKFDSLTYTRTIVFTYDINQTIVTQIIDGSTTSYIYSKIVLSEPSIIDSIIGGVTNLFSNLLNLLPK